MSENWLAILPAALFLLAGCARQPAATAPAAEKRLTARVYDSGFADAHDTYNGMGAASDGKIYYVLSSEKHDVAA
ncbi:MAG: hypothetical protein AAB654_19520, partial [Acidobacteriota bacterium]